MKFVEVLPIPENVPKVRIFYFSVLFYICCLFAGVNPVVGFTRALQVKQTDASISNTFVLPTLLS
jgi:hypothetical protein